MKQHKTQKLYDIASLQQGYFTSLQARSAGFSRRMHVYYKQTGEWLEITRGIFRLARYPHSPDEDYVIWSLWSCDRYGNIQAVVSHDSALSVHGLSDIMPSKIHLTVPGKFRKKPDASHVVLHRGNIPPEAQEEREGFHVTTPLRSIIDSAEDALSLDYLQQAIEGAQDRGLLQIIDLVSSDMSEKARDKIIFVLKNIKCGY